MSKELNTTVYALPDGQGTQELTIVIIIGLDQCSFYNISVSAWNDYGQGNIAYQFIRQGLVFSLK